MKRKERGAFEMLEDSLKSGQISRRQFLRIAALVGLGGPAAAYLAGCAPSTPAAAPPTATAVPAATAAPTEPAALATLVWAFDQDIDNLDVQDFVSDAAYMNMTNSYAGPTTYAGKPAPTGEILQDDFNIIPWAAESFELGDDLKTLTLVVRKNAKFSDGTPVTADDVVYTFTRAIERPGSMNGPMDMMALTSPDQIVKLDEYTVEIRPNKAHVREMQMVTRIDMGILSKAWSEEHATSEDPWASTWYRANSMGCGPYFLEKWEPGVEFVLKPNPYFWDQSRFRNAGHIVKFIPDGSSRLALLKGGDVDLATGIPPKDLMALEEDPNVVVHKLRTDAYNFMGMNNKIPPLDNKLVRQAISYAVPYDTIIEKAMYGYAERLYGPCPTIMPTFDESLWDQYGYETDMDKAKSKLAEAGYPGGEGLPTLEMSVLASKENWVEVAVWIQSALAELGIQATVNKMADAPFFEKFLAREMAMPIHWFRAWLNHPSYHSYYMLHSESPINWYNYSNPEVDRLIEAGMYEPDPQKQEDDFKQAHALAIQDAPCVWLFSIQQVTCRQSNVTGMSVYDDGMFRLDTFTKS